jgi:hypothetical protein
MSALRKSYHLQSRMPDVELLRTHIDELNKLEPADHLSWDPRYRSLKFCYIGIEARDQIVRWLTECAEYIERPQSRIVMARFGSKGFIIDP